MAVEKQEGRRSLSGTLANLAVVGCFAAVVIGLFGHQIGTLVAPLLSYSSNNIQPTTQPTSTNVQRYYDQQAAPSTSVEDNLVHPTTRSVVAPLAPAGNVTAATSKPAIAPANFSPIDLGSIPAATPTSGLTQEQLDASAASEEANQLNTMQSGMTDAQQLVQQHDAEWNASNP